MYQNFESLREGCMIIQNTNLKLGLVNILKLYTFKSEFHALVPYNLSCFGMFYTSENVIGPVIHQCIAMG